MLDAKINTGAFTGTGVAINIEVGFTPKYVKVINLNDGGGLEPTLEWHQGMAAASALKLTGTPAYNLITTLGITQYAGDAGMTALTGTIEMTLGSAVLAGTLTKFLSELKAGDVIHSVYDGKTFKVLNIVSDTSLVADAVAEGTVATKAFARVNGRAAGFTLGADTDVNVAGEAGVWMAIGD